MFVVGFFEVFFDFFVDFFKCFDVIGRESRCDDGDVFFVVFFGQMCDFFDCVRLQLVFGVEFGLEGGDEIGVFLIQMFF